LQNVTVNGVTREYKLFVPAGVTYPSSLVVAWHGIGSSPDEIEKKMKMQPQAESHKFILVYPEAKNKGGGLFNPAAFNGAACCKNDNSFKDVDFMTAIKARLVGDGCVASGRVFSMGYSNGGFMTHRLACEDSTLVTAAAIHSGTYGDYNGNLANSPWGNCDKKEKVPVIGFMGSADKTVPYLGGNNPSPLGSAKWFSWTETMDVWAAQNQCGSPMSVTYNENGQSVNMTTWSQCDVESHVVSGMGHDWFSGATSRIVGFFKGNGL